jgi:hypothetical protein
MTQFLGGFRVKKTLTTNDGCYPKGWVKNFPRMNLKKIEDFIFRFQLIMLSCFDGNSFNLIGKVAIDWDCLKLD